MLITCSGRYIEIFRRDTFVDWMDHLEVSISELKQESLSTPEYRRTLEQFQVSNLFILHLRLTLTRLILYLLSFLSFDNSLLP